MFLASDSSNLVETWPFICRLLLSIYVKSVNFMSPETDMNSKNSISREVLSHSKNSILEFLPSLSDAVWLAFANQGLAEEAFAVN